MVDVHTIATFAFAQLRRDPDFRERVPWVRNTVVCVETDLVDDVLMSQMRHYFPDGGGTVACYYPADKRFMFIHAQGPYGPEESKPESIQAHDRNRELTMGRVIDAIYSNRKNDWSHLPRFSMGEVGEASTVEIEKKLALT